MKRLWHCATELEFQLRNFWLQLSTAAASRICPPEGAQRAILHEIYSCRQAPIASVQEYGQAFRCPGSYGSVSGTATQGGTVGVMAEEQETHTPATWFEFVADHPKFPDMMWRWITLMQKLLKATPMREGDDLGFLICGFMTASVVDVNDILTLTYANSRTTGAAKILRSIYERTVTMKHLAANPLDVPKFIGYQSIDWQQVMEGCEEKLGYGLEEPARSNLANAAHQARQEYKGEVCPTCKQRKRTDWTPKSVKERAELIGLAHMHFHGYIAPSKMMHPTFYGMMEMMKSAPPLYNILNCMHELLVHNVLIHRRHFVSERQPTPMMKEAVEDYLRIWVYAETSFGGMLTNHR